MPPVAVVVAVLAAEEDVAEAEGEDSEVEVKRPELVLCASPAMMLEDGPPTRGQNSLPDHGRARMHTMTTFTVVPVVRNTANLWHFSKFLRGCPYLAGHSRRFFGVQENRK